MNTPKTSLIPNTFQHPNFYVDVIDELLTPEESKVLTHAIREILGWRDSLQTRQKHISRDIFLHGRTVNGQKVYGGVNLCADALQRALNALHTYRILVRVGSSRDWRGQCYELTESIEEIDMAGLRARHAEKHAAQKVRSLAVAAKKERHSSVAQATHSSVRQASDSSVSQTTYSSVRQATYSSVAQAERKPSLETQKEKPITPSSSLDISSANNAQKTEEEGAQTVSFSSEKTKTTHSPAPRDTAPSSNPFLDELPAPPSAMIAPRHPLAATGSDFAVTYPSPANILTPDERERVVTQYGLTIPEVEGFLYRNHVAFTELATCLDAIYTPKHPFKYTDFNGHPIQRPLGFIFASQWLAGGRACPPSRHAAQAFVERTRWNNQQFNDIEIEKTRQRLRERGVNV